MSGGGLVEDVVNPVPRGVGKQSLDIGVAVGWCLVGLPTRARCLGRAGTSERWKVKQLQKLMQNFY